MRYWKSLPGRAFRLDGLQWMSDSWLRQVTSRDVTAVKVAGLTMAREVFTEFTYAERERRSLKRRVDDEEEFGRVCWHWEVTNV